MVDSEKKQQPKLLIITGPQGSGNHLFAKIFSMHPSVEGWPMLRDEWQGHHEEPFADYWQEPKTLKDKIWGRQYYVTSISCPYFKDKQPQIPKYREFINEAKKYCEVIICIIGRDRNILEHQQNRVRDGHTTPTAIEHFEQLYNICDDTHFVSHELFFLYGANYLKILSRDINFPIAYNHATLIEDFLKKSETNHKYIKATDKGKFDEEVKTACDES